MGVDNMLIDILMVLTVVASIMIAVYFVVVEDFNLMMIAFQMLFLMLVALGTLMYLDGRNTSTQTQYTITISQIENNLKSSDPYSPFAGIV